jgi:hypothetical protein
VRALGVKPYLDPRLEFLVPLAGGSDRIGPHGYLVVGRNPLPSRGRDRSFRTLERNQAGPGISLSVADNLRRVMTLCYWWLLDGLHPVDSQAAQVTL